MDAISLGVLCGLGFGVVDVLVMLPMKMENRRKKIETVTTAFIERFMLGFLIPNVSLDTSDHGRRPAGTDAQPAFGHHHPCLRADYGNRTGRGYHHRRDCQHGFVTITEGELELAPTVCSLDSATSDILLR
ncbi:MAG: hypothetical protein ABSD79_02955 [Dehalococcoidales bacterium]